MRLFFILFTVISFQFLSAQKDSVIPYGDNPKAGGYVTSGNAKVYYEVYGQGQPLLILHGNGGSIKARARSIPEYAKKYKVIAMDSRCHGKTSCPPGYATYEQIAADANALLTHLKLDSVYIWGHSDGAIVGLLMAIHYPSKVKKLLATGGNLRPDSTAVDPEAFTMVDEMKKNAKDSIQIKLINLLTEQPHIPVSDLHKISAEVLIMAGDRDIIRNKHSLEIFDNIKNAYLCILPGTTHYVYSQREKWFTEIMYDFFDNPQRKATTVQMMKGQMKKQK
ncbi:MAG: alpha/beta fold hydrolase [Bacteroidia bacterium]